MMLEGEGVHPDEGTIHAWLDGALGAGEAARIEAHVAGCAECASRVAEARGLIAGASRVVGLLDERPAPLIRPAVTPTANTDLTVWRLLRVTPTRASIAAMLVVAVGIAFTRGHMGVDERAMARDSSAVARVAAPLSAGASPAASPASEPRANDTVLASAIERRLAKEQPPRTIEPARGVNVPAAPAMSGAAPGAEPGVAESKVLAARASIAAQRDSVGVGADRTRAGVGQLAAGANAAEERVTVAAKAADASTARIQLRGAGVTGGIAAGACYRVESATPAVWGSVPLPLILAMQPASFDARVLTPTGGETEERAYLRYNGSDSARFDLRRIGYTGSLMLTPGEDLRTGAMRSSASTLQLSEVVVTSAPTAALRTRPDSAAMRDARRAGAAAPSPAPSIPSTPVTARKVACP